ncbi:MAG: carbohydrate kinase [Cyanobacteria bacterium CRU_2_1]|nr:carbohydrate kinase [Cyanobacteria bacterium RU_5_0]NJR58557.1 carbohydrate kinase [Cyanobacteria bacterium CRU_2_1]
MSHPHVLCIGEILWDCLADQSTSSVEQVQSWTQYPGGAPANVACALVKLGTSAGFIGCVGEDEAGEALVRLLETIGVNRVGIQRHPTAPTRMIEVLRSPSGDRSFAGFIGRDTTEFADTYLQATLIPVELFKTAEFLVMGTLEFAYPDTRQAIERALEFANQHYLKILLDVNWRPMFWTKPETAKPMIHQIIRQVDFLKLSHEEAEWLFDTADPGAIAYRLGDVEGVLVTNGNQGCAYCLNESEGKVPAFRVNVKETTGAGDSFVAGFLHQLCRYGIQALSDPDIARTMMTYANAVGALTTTRAGAIAAQPTAAEVEAFLALNRPPLLH